MSRTALSPLIKAQVDKLTTTTTASGPRFLDSSSPIIIPKKAICSNNTSSQSSSSYTSIADQMSSSAETFLQNHRDFDHVYTSLPMLPSTCEKLEHTAAKDRIQVKNKRQQQRSKGKLNVVDEGTVDDQSNVFASTPDEEEEIVQSVVPTTTAPQITVDLADLDTARARLRVTSRPRDHSADNILPSSTPNIPIQTSNVQRSVSFKRPQEINEAKYLHRTIRKIERNDDADTDKDPKRSTQEHIYDNLDIFKQKKTNDKSDVISTTYSSSVNMREHTVPTTARLRPVTMHFSSTSEKQTPSEFENVFNQLKKRSSIKRIQPNEEEKEKQEPERPTLPLPVKIEEPPTHVIKENEPIAPVLVSTNKLTVTSSISQPPPNRRRTVGGVHLPGNNKVNTEEPKPTPSWIDIAKQKQSKFQSVANEIEEQKTSVETVIVSSKPTNIPSNTNRIQENISDDSRTNQKPKYEPIIVRRTPPAAAATTTHMVERDSIRALKANNSNRINNLIQFFDK